MSDEYFLTRRDFMRVGAVVAGVTAYAARVAGARGAEGQLEAEAKSAPSVPVESDYERWKRIELECQMRAFAILHRHERERFYSHKAQ